MVDLTAGGADQAVAGVVGVSADGIDALVLEVRDGFGSVVDLQQVTDRVVGVMQILPQGLTSAAGAQALQTHVLGTKLSAGDHAVARPLLLDQTGGAVTDLADQREFAGAHGL
ncbi:hypothetical protein D3C84_883340 [compost metagenome]